MAPNTHRGPILSSLIDPKISFGTILEIIALVFLVGTAYSSLLTGQNQLKEQFAAHNSEIEQLRREYVRADLQKERDERLDEKLDNLQDSMAEIKKLIR